MSLHILHIVFNTFLKARRRRIRLAIKELLVIISFIPVTFMFNSGGTLKGEIRCLSLLGVKGLRRKLVTLTRKKEWDCNVQVTPKLTESSLQ